MTSVSHPLFLNLPNTLPPSTSMLWTLQNTLTHLTLLFYCKLSKSGKLLYVLVRNSIETFTNLHNVHATRLALTSSLPRNFLVPLTYYTHDSFQHGGQAPQSYAEKKTFRDQVIRGSKKTDEENFSEAYKTAHKAYTPYSIPSTTQAVLNDPQTHNLNANSDPFWVIATAVREFVENEGQGKLPLMGSIPDMHSTTEGYIALQKVYVYTYICLSICLFTLCSPHVFILFSFI